MRILVLFTALFLTGAAQAQEAVEVEQPSADMSVQEELQTNPLYIYEEQEAIVRLQNLERNWDVDGVVETIRAIDSGDEMKESLLWLRERVMADDTPDPRYALLYAESLLRVIGDDREANTALMESAAMIYLYGRLTLMVDAQRCLERSVAYQKIDHLLTGFDEIKAFYDGLSEERRRDILRVAMRLEDRISSRMPNDALCISDPQLALSSRIERAKRLARAAKDKEPTVEEELFTLMDEIESETYFVTMKTWLERRQEERRNFAEQYE